MGMTATELELFEMALTRVMEGAAEPQEYAMFARIAELEIENKTLRDERGLILNRAEWLQGEYQRAMETAMELPENVIAPRWEDEPIDPKRLLAVLGAVAAVAAIGWWFGR